MPILTLAIERNPTFLYQQRLLLCYLTKYAAGDDQKYLEGVQNLFDEIADQYYGATGDERAFLTGSPQEDKQGKARVRKLADALRTNLEKDST